MKKIATLIMLFTTVLFGAAVAQPMHPAYIHALKDLRIARWLIEHHQGDWVASADEHAAVGKINDAINEIKKASIDDGKDIDEHVKSDEISGRNGRLDKALDYLNKARRDIAAEETNGAVLGLRDRAYRHIDEAIRLTRRARNS